MRELPAAFAAMAAYRQWVNWIAVPRTDGSGKTDKFPFDARTGEVRDAHDTSLWVDAQTAIANAATGGCGVGFVFTEQDPYFFIDVDSCLIEGRWSPTAIELCSRFQGAAVEISQSGKGLHIIGTGRAGDHSCKNVPLGIELYTARRFIAMTGISAIGSAATECTPALQALVAQYFPPKVTVAGREWTVGPREDWRGIEDDDALIVRALSSKSARAVLTGGVTFRDLWECNADALGRQWPDGDQGRAYDASSADAALAQHLTFWTGSDCERILRLMRQSALVRDKWDREDYLYRTITRAVSLQKEVHKGGNDTQPTAVTPGATETAGDLSSNQFLAATQQVEHFRGCVYIRDMHRIFTPDGAFLKPEQFKATYGGFTFSMDSMNEKTTRNAFEAFTESQAVRFPKAAGAVFRPELPPGEIVEEEDQKLVNTYVPINTLAIPGDPAPFLDLIRRLLPDPRDQRILLSYLAAIVQHKGRKFQWWPVLQGVEGNGKTLIISAVAHAVGQRYSFCPKVDAIVKSGNQFNGWVRNRLFLGMEEIYVPERRDFLNAFKTTVTNKRLPIESKGVDQMMCDNRANGIMSTNFREGVPVNVDTRRYAIFYTAQQTKADLQRDGMTGDYFPRLYDWVEGRGYPHASYGYAVINYFLQNYEISEEFNPAGLCQTAPTTSSTEAAVQESRGGIEQEVLEAIDEGRPGFCGGWVSSMMLDRLFESLRVNRQIPPNKRRELMKTLGYDWHPALKDGRVNNIILPDGGKPRLFIKQGHIYCNLQSPAEVARHYSEAQGAVGAGVLQATEVFRK